MPATLRDSEIAAASGASDMVRWRPSTKAGLRRNKGSRPMRSTKGQGSLRKSYQGISSSPSSGSGLCRRGARARGASAGGRVVSVNGQQTFESCSFTLKRGLAGRNHSPGTATFSTRLLRSPSSTLVVIAFHCIRPSQDQESLCPGSPQFRFNVALSVAFPVLTQKMG